MFVGTGLKKKKTPKIYRYYYLIGDVGWIAIGWTAGRTADGVHVIHGATRVVNWTVDGRTGSARKAHGDL